MFAKEMMISCQIRILVNATVILVSKMKLENLSFWDKYDSLFS